MDNVLNDHKALPDDVATLQAMLRDAQTTLLKREQKIEALYQLIYAYQEAKRLAAARQFAPSSEAEARQYYLFNEAECNADETAVSKQTHKTTEVKAHQRRGGRAPLPEHLPRIEIIHDLSEAEKQCACGCRKEKIGEQTTEQLDIIPAKVRVLKHIRLKYACQHCDSAPDTAYVVTSKYADALPLYRQCHILKRGGVDVARHTLCHQVVKAGELTQPLINLLEETALNYAVLQMDETTVQVLNEPDKRAQSQSYMWVMRGGPPDQSSIIYHYDPGRGQEVATRLLEGYQGYLQTDAWHAYDAVHSKGIVAVACWAHARRKFKDAEKALPKGKRKSNPSLQRALGFIQALYGVEKTYRNATADKRHAARQQHSVPILNQFKAWLDKQNINPQSRLGKAMAYTLKYWDRLTVYCTDGRIEIDNNGIENKIRPFAVGRKNWLFSTSQAGAKASANLYSLIETAKANGLNEYDYLKWVFAKLPAANTIQQIEALLPWNIDKVDLVNWAYG